MATSRQSRLLQKLLLGLVAIKCCCGFIERVPLLVRQGDLARIGGLAIAPRLGFDPSEILGDHFTILFENEHLLAINKPPGIPHHTTREGELGILARIRQAQEYGTFGYEGRLYGVHRLDRVTSGILLLAKNADAASDVARAFATNKVVKYYTGISRHKPLIKKQGWVQGGMVRGRRKSWYLTRDYSSKNYARTRFFTAGLGALQIHLLQQQVAPPKTLLLFRPYTGRTHQLRVAAKSIGLPLLGDPIYRDSFDSDGMQRTYLHATGLHIAPDDQTLALIDGITLWSHPPFEHLWDKQGRDGFDEILKRLVEKHCDCNNLKEVVCGPTSQNSL